MPRWARGVLERYGWSFQAKACFSAFCHLDPTELERGEGVCRSHGPDCLSACQCTNL